MANADFDTGAPGAGISRGAAASRVVTLTGAAATLALAAGLVIWGYKLAVRDAQGVPVIQAMDGPIREPSHDPGGRITDHAGLSVNRIAGYGTAGALPDQIVLGSLGSTSNQKTLIPAAWKSPLTTGFGLPNASF